VWQARPKARKTSCVQADNESILRSEGEKEFFENERMTQECL